MISDEKFCCWEKFSKGTRWTFVLVVCFRFWTEKITDCMERNKRKYDSVSQYHHHHQLFVGRSEKVDHWTISWYCSIATNILMTCIDIRLNLIQDHHHYMLSFLSESNRASSVGWSTASFSSSNLKPSVSFSDIGNDRLMVLDLSFNSSIMKLITEYFSNVWLSLPVEFHVTYIFMMYWNQRFSDLPMEFFSKIDHDWNFVLTWFLRFWAHLTHVQNESENNSLAPVIDIFFDWM